MPSISAKGLALPDSPIRNLAPYTSVGVNVAPDEIMVSTDGSEALQFVFTCGMNPGDEVIVPVSFYANCACFAMLAGARAFRSTTRIPSAGGYSSPSITTAPRS